MFPPCNVTGKSASFLCIASTFLCNSQALGSQLRQASKRRRCCECDSYLDRDDYQYAPCGAGPMHWSCLETHYFICPDIDCHSDTESSSSGEDVDSILRT